MTPPIGHTHKEIKAVVTLQYKWTLHHGHVHAPATGDRRIISIQASAGKSSGSIDTRQYATVGISRSPAREIDTGNEEEQYANCIFFKKRILYLPPHPIFYTLD